MSSANIDRFHRIPLVEFLRMIKPQEARTIIVMLAQGGITGIKSGTMPISQLEKVVFNLDVLLFCKKELKDAKLRKIIEAGMELEDVFELVKAPGELLRACSIVERMIWDINFYEEV
jgi:hypothetical protein